MWISYFGVPRNFLSDYGTGGFSNEKYREMNEELNIETATTPYKSLFSFGIVERYNQILAESFYNIIAKLKWEPKIILARAISAKNILQNDGVFRSNQLEFGVNANFLLGQ